MANTVPESNKSHAESVAKILPLIFDTLVKAIAYEVGLQVSGVNLPGEKYGRSNPDNATSYEAPAQIQEDPPKTVEEVSTAARAFISELSGGITVGTAFNKAREIYATTIFSGLSAKIVKDLPDSEMQTVYKRIEATFQNAQLLANLKGQVQEAVQAETALSADSEV